MSQPTAQTICEDVLYSTFLHTMPATVDGDGSRIDITTIEPMNLSMVCRSWRTSVLSHPNLWGHFQIMNSTFTPARASLHHFLSKWLEYSQASPLRIFYELCCLGDEGDKILADIVSTTVAQHSRLEDVDIYMEYPEEPFTFQVSSTLASLRLNLFWHDCQVPSKLVACFNFNYCAVNTTLRTLCVSEGVRWILPKHPHQSLRFPNLTELKICTDLTGNMDDFHAVLAACPNITTLSVQARQSVRLTSAHMLSTGEAVLLPNLTHLVISSENRTATIQLLRWVTCPSLINLVVEVPEDIVKRNKHEAHFMTTALLNAYGKFFARSRPPLESLELIYLTSPPSFHNLGRALRNILHPLQTLTELILYEVAIDNELFEEMTLHDGEGNGVSAICPLLTLIDISNFDSTTLSFGVQQSTVKSMIHSRRESPARNLRSFDIHFLHFRYKDTVQA